MLAAACEPDGCEREGILSGGGFFDTIIRARFKVLRRIISVSWPNKLGILPAAGDDGFERSRSALVRHQRCRRPRAFPHHGDSRNDVGGE